MNNIDKILYTDKQIKEAISSLSEKINNYYKGQEDIVIMPILDGAIVFCGKILTNLNFGLELRSIKINSYYDNKFSNKRPIIDHFISQDYVKDKKILILEDMIDQGYTISLLKNKLYEMGAKEIKICVLFKKETKNSLAINSIKPDWFGLSIPDEWVAGYGIDSKGKFRNLNFIATIKD